MIKRLTVRKLNGRSDFDLCFNEDMNILTGKNGCGKTTLLKLVWYMISGNLDRIPAEINFEAASIITESFTLSVTLNNSADTRRRAEWKMIDKEGSISVVPSIYSLLAPPSNDLVFPPVYNEIDGIRKQIGEALGGSVFFPTFRRVEGGFSINKSDKRASNSIFYGSTDTKVADAMNELSERLSEGKHKFVASISTTDVVDMMSKRYAQVSQRINRDNTRLSHNITAMISDYVPTQSAENDTEKLSHLIGVLNRIQHVVAVNSSTQESLLQPFTALGQLLTQILQHKGIRIATGITLGEVEDAISSDVLSAGEKQMLSFVAYNAFTRDSVIFIDEPEISLHVDWQRTLFPILQSQGTNNQFIVATHSPFIYSKYVDKEIMLDKDRGE